MPAINTINDYIIYYIYVYEQNNKINNRYYIYYIYINNTYVDNRIIKYRFNKDT